MKYLWHDVLHIFVCKLQCPDGFDKVFVLTQPVHHCLFGQKLAGVIVLHQYAVETEHTTDVTVEQRLVLVDVVAHLGENSVLDHGGVAFSL